MHPLYTEVKGIGKRCWFGLWGFVLGVIFISSPMVWADGDTVAFSGRIIDGTCSIVANPSAIKFTTVSVNDFSAPKQTLETQPLVLTLDDCQGLPDGRLRAAIFVEGTVAAFDSNLYQDVKSSTKGVGVLLRAEKYTGGLNDFYNPAKAVRSGDYTYSYPTGNFPTSDSQLNYTLGFTNGNGKIPVSPGDFSAALTFSFQYH